MRRCAFPVALLVVVVLCCSLAAASAIAVPLTLHRERQNYAREEQSVSAQLPEWRRSLIAKDETSIAAGLTVQQLHQPRAQQIEPVVDAAVEGAVVERAREDAKELRAVPAHVSVLAADASSASSATADSDSRTAAEKYGTILSGGVIASVTIVLVFACLLVLLVAIEVGSSVSSVLEHRRMRKERLSKNGDDPAEPKYGDFRDTAVNMQV